ncbi:sensor histidine kinase [Aurantiacibacter rhizosphaerae]|uniref:histidine kinase n=1 Tax=Aurantiacibacter rhizosphaerae TaxID=2691582 RepID=A0A844XG50_9SPHN|nr:histidine kinase dimerization/phosphoacceptor domain -containing protein [Aurantiacibacter rhizosphaerae]MWV28996.1 histidine kinase [Aurantiacibacter rhizosphaerae]
MYRLAGFDVPRRFDAPIVRVLVQCLFGLGCTLAMIGFRSFLDVWAATAGPFALVYPTVLIATLYGHLKAGIVTYVTSFLWAWYFVLPTVHGFTFEVATDPSRVVINGAAVLVVMLFAESFRRAVVTAIDQRDEQIARATMLQQELEHRTKNNFALAASLLEMQKRREQLPEVISALEQAIARIHSFSSAYSNLALTQGEGAMVAMQDYLADVVDRVTRGAFMDNVRVEVEIDSDTHHMPREVAVAIGLFTNEALTNCAKYAFPNGRDGNVKVKFTGASDNWSLAIDDDGIGTAGVSAESTGIGERLFAAFAQQAGAQYHVEATPSGRSLRLASQGLN